MDTKVLSKAPSGRIKRASINGTRNRLEVRDKDPNFVYRIVNDSPGRVQEFLEAGWEIDSKTKVGNSRVGLPTSEGTHNQLHVGSGLKAYIMRIKREWYEEDQAEKQRAVVQSEEALKQAGDYGKLKINQS